MKARKDKTRQKDSGLTGKRPNRQEAKHAKGGGRREEAVSLLSFYSDKR
jgi:hypothetical protein